MLLFAFSIAACGIEEDFEDPYFEDEAGYEEDAAFEDDYEEDPIEEDYDTEEDVAPEVVEEDAAVEDVDPEPVEEDPAPEPETEDAAAEDTSMADDMANTNWGYTPISCAFDAPGNVECGILSVPENRTKADSPMIELAVAIIRADNPLPDPVIYLEGGPGGSAVLGLANDPEGWLEYDFGRDLILFDQRGTGLSVPSLNCPELEDIDFDSGSVNPEQDAAIACRDRLLSEGVDLTAYNTAENAADVDALRQALGYEKANLYGISYGTRLGLAVMRDHPAGLRSVVLDSPFPPNADVIGTEALYQYGRVEHLFNACAADDWCNEAYGDIKSTYLQLVADLDANPALIDGGEVFGDTIINVMYQIMFAGEGVDLLPRMIHDIAVNNDFEAFYLAEEIAGIGGGASRLYQGDTEGKDDSEGMYAAVMCHDEFVFGDIDAAEDIVTQTLPEELHSGMFYSATVNQYDTCQIWQAGAAAPSEDAAVVSDIPTLILVGEYDPATPPEWGVLTKETLSNAHLFEIPGRGHSLTSGLTCSTQMMTAFFNDPAGAPDSSCIADLPEMQFVLPDEDLNEIYGE